MKESETILNRLMQNDYPIFIHRETAGYTACIPSLGIIASANTLDDCYAKIEVCKKNILEAIIEHGFGQPMLSELSTSPKQRSCSHFVFILAALFILLLTVLIPANFLLSELNRRIPTYVESSMDVIQRRVHQMSEEDQRKLSGLTTRMCPVINEMIEARCKSDLLHDFRTSGERLRKD